jgi:hypothetical protein
MGLHSPLHFQPPRPHPPLQHAYVILQVLLHLQLLLGGQLLAKLLLMLRTVCWHMLYEALQLLE